MFLIVVFAATAAQIFSQTGRPTLAVIDFNIRPNVHHEAGREMSEMLVNALLETGQFTVVDRTRTAQIQEEQRKVLMGSVDPAVGAKVGQMLGAQWLVIGSVTEFQEKKAGGLPGLFGGVIGAEKIVAYRANVKFNLQVIQSTTGEIAFSKSFEKAGSAAGLSGSGAVFDLPEFRSKAMHDAVGSGIRDAVALLVTRLGVNGDLSASATPVQKESPAAPNCSSMTGGKAPRVMVVIPEVHISRPIPDPAGETEIIKKLVGQGFNIVDQSQIAAIRNREKVLTAINNPAAAAALGVEYGAQIIIIGEAFSELAGRENNMVSTRARVEARAIQTDTARILAADGKFGSGLDVAEFVSAKTALRNAGSQWADYFIGQVCRASGPAGGGAPSAGFARATPATPTPVEIVISKISYPQLKQFSDRVEKLTGVVSVDKRVTGNVGRIDVQYVGGAEKLADAISETRFGLMKVNIVGLSGNKIEITIGQ